jgi:hypothetical protein
MNRLVNIFLFLCIFFLGTGLHAQLSTNYKNKVKLDVSYLLAEKIPNQSSTDKAYNLLHRNDIKNEIAKAIKANDVKLISLIFAEYTSVLDTLVVSQPNSARELIVKLQKYFSGDKQSLERLLYYSSAVDYFAGLYVKAESDLIQFLKNYPNSNVVPDAFTLLLKTILVNEGYKEAQGIIKGFNIQYSDEQKYYLGHIYYTLEEDSLAKDFFSQINDPRYSTETKLLIRLLNIISSQYQSGMDDLGSILRSEPNNPFILLALARIESKNRNWTEADSYYSKFVKVNKTYWEMQVIFESAMTLMQKGDNSQAIQILEKALNSKLASNYEPALIFLWTHLLANDNQIERVRLWLDQAVEIGASNKSLILQKQSILNELLRFKNQINNNSGSIQINSYINEILAKTGTIDSLNAIISNNPIGLSANYMTQWLFFEKRVAMNLLMHLDNLLTTEALKNVQDTLHIEKLEKLESVYGEQLSQINKIRNSLIKLNDDNTYLAIRNEIDNNLKVLDELIENLIEMKRTGQSKYTLIQLDSLIVVNERKRAETALLIDYYDFDNSLYKEILEECDIATKSTLALMKKIPAIKEEYKLKYPKYLSKKEKNSILSELSESILVSSEYTKIVSDQILNSDRVLSDLNFFDNYVAFVETSNIDKFKKSKEKTLSFEENQSLFKENQARKQIVYNKSREYLASQTAIDFTLADHYKSIVYDKISIANFILAELSNSLFQDNPKHALTYYRNILQRNPNFFYIDAVLYNIGYLSSFVVKDEIENALLNFESSRFASNVKPEALRLSEVTLSEPIGAYSKLISEYTSTTYYIESLIRLGNLYFDIGTNADTPVEYYQKARNYFDQAITNSKDNLKYQALYQRGWTWLNSGTEEAYFKAIEDFSELLKAIDNNVLTDSTEVVDYTVSSIKNMAFCLIGLDGSETEEPSKGATYAASNLSKIVNAKHISPIIDEAINQKLKLFLPMHVVEFLKAKISLDPLSIYNPIIADSICNIYKSYPTSIRKGLSADSVLIEEKIKIIENYGLNSPWYKANASKDLKLQFSVIKQAFLDLEKRYNNVFIDSPTIANLAAYEQIVEKYSLYTELHDANDAKWFIDRNANIVALHIKLANTIKSMNQYAETAKRIYAYNDVNEGSVSYFNLEGAAYEIAELIYVANFADTEKSEEISKIVQFPFSLQFLQDYYMKAINRFLSVLVKNSFRSKQNDELYIAVASRQAEIARNNKLYPQAAYFYQKIIEFDGIVSNDIKRSVYINLAEISDSTKNYSDAEKFYKEAGSYSTNRADKEVLHQYAMLQIQNSIEDATKNGNNKLAADEYLRLSNEYSSVNPVVSIQYKAKAQVAYLAAKEYQKSMELLIELASTRSKPSEVLDFYRLAWGIADSINASNQSDSLKYAFINKYPTSNEAYQLRLSLIDKKVNNPNTVKDAGEAYLTLYDDVISKKINAGNDRPEDIFLAAIGLFAQTGDESRKETLSEDFVKKYPNHASSLTLMEYLTDRQLEKGDTIRFEQMSKAIFVKDKSMASRYTNLAKNKLRKIATDFDQAYARKDWNLAFSKRDEFKKLHNGYEKEGLTLDFSPVYQLFNNADSEYKQIQDRVAFIKSYNFQIDNTVNTFTKKNPEDLLRVNANTKWKKNMISGDNRIQALKNLTSSEVKKIRTLLESGAKYDLSVDERLKAFDAICKINEFASNVMKKQIDKYIETSSEFKEFLRQFSGAEEELYSGFYTQRDGHALSFMQQAYPYYSAMYKYFYIAGLKNDYTKRAQQRLESLNALPRYRFENISVNDWNLTIVNNDDSTIVQNYKNSIDVNKSKDNVVLSKLTIPGNSRLVMSKSIKLKVPYEYIVASVVSPYFDDTQVFINSELVDYSYNAIDTLKTGDNSSIRQALILGESKFIAENNEVTLRLFNFDNNPLVVNIGFLSVIDSVKIEAAIPIDTLLINSDDTWQYRVYNKGKSMSEWKKAQKSSNFGLTKNQWFEMEDTAADAIWLNKTDDSDSVFVIFQKEIEMNGILKEGTIRFIAPDVASVKINNIELASDFLLNYDEESDLVFPGQISINPKDILKGKNVLQITVSNRSKFKGIVSETRFVIAHPE